MPTSSVLLNFEKDLKEEQERDVSDGGPLLTEISTTRRQRLNQPAVQIDDKIQVVRSERNDDDHYDDDDACSIEVEFWNERLDQFVMLSSKEDSSPKKYKKFVASLVKKLYDDISSESSSLDETDINHVGSSERCTHLSLSRWMIWAVGKTSTSLENDHEEEKQLQIKRKLLAAISLLSSCMAKFTKLDNGDDAIGKVLYSTRVCFSYNDVLLQICQCSTTRTNLSARTFRLFCSIVHKIALDGSCDDEGNKESAGKALWESLDVIREMLKCRKLWNRVELNKEFKDKEACYDVVIDDFLSIVTDMIRARHEINSLRLSERERKIRVRRNYSYICYAFAGAQMKIVYVPDQRSQRYGGLDFLESSTAKRISIEEAASALTSASELLKNKQTNETCNISDYELKSQECQRQVSRMFLAWLSVIKEDSLIQFWRSKHSSVSPLQVCMESSMMLLTSKSEACVSMSLMSLKRLWSDTGGLPRDLFEGDSSGCCKSFDIMVDSLQADSLNDASSKALCLLLVKAIKQKPLLFPRMSCRLGACEISYEIASQLSQECDGLLANAICNFFVSNIHDPRVQRLSRSTPLLKNSNVITTVPKLLSIILESDNADISGAASDSLCFILLYGDRKSAVPLIVDYLCSKFDSELPKNDVNKSPDKIVKFCGIWRRKLIADGDEMAFSDVIISLCKYMFKHPERKEPLNIYGALLGNGNDIVPSNISEQRRLYEALKSILRVCNEYFECLDRTNEGQGIFQRLSPLLILRRIPICYFDMIRSGNAFGGSLIEGNLGRFLVERLTRKSEIECDRFSEKEVRLAAEVCGRCLPFVNTDDQINKASSFNDICFPAFDKVMQMDSDSNYRRQVLKNGRLSLYVACHFVMSLSKLILNEGISISIIFAIRMLCRQESSNDFIQLQTGCIDFLSICIDKSLTEHRKSDLNLKVQDETHSHNNLSNIFPNLASVLSMLLSIFVEQKIPSQITNSPYLPESWRAHFENGEDIEYSTQVCCMNAIILVSQRCSDKNESLFLLKKNSIPVILSWTKSSKSLKPNYLSICSALQAAFNLITRSKSFNGIENSIRPLHRWALDIVKESIREGEEESQVVEAMRSAALKLMLSIITIGAHNIADLSLNPGDVGETMNVLRGTATMDSNPEVRKLANYIIEAFENPRRN